jgi:hypothetical protein
MPVGLNASFNLVKRFLVQPGNYFEMANTISKACGIGIDKNEDKFYN